MRKPLLLTLATDNGFPAGTIIVDMDKIVAMCTAIYTNPIDNTERKFTKMLPVAGTPIQVMELMRDIWEQLDLVDEQVTVSER